jgi:hypothetical protein
MNDRRPRSGRLPPRHSQGAQARHGQHGHLAGSHRSRREAPVRAEGTWSADPVRFRYSSPGDSLWIIAEHGTHAGYVRNIQHDPGDSAAGLAGDSVDTRNEN